MATFSDLESQASVRAKINAAITKVDDADAIGNLTARRFDTVTELFDYSATPRLTVGTYVEAGGFRYLVVSSGEHVTTAGGDKLTVVRNKNGSYSPEAFGAPTAESQLAAVDCLAALNAAAAAAEADNATLQLDRGFYGLSAQFEFGCSMVGAGQGATAFVALTGDFSPLKLADDADYITVGNFRVRYYGGSRSTGTGLTFYRANHNLTVLPIVSVNFAVGFDFNALNYVQYSQQLRADDCEYGFRADGRDVDDSDGGTTFVMQQCYAVDCEYAFDINYFTDVTLINPIVDMTGTAIEAFRFLGCGVVTMINPKVEGSPAASGTLIRFNTSGNLGQSLTIIGGYLEAFDISALTYDFLTVGANDDNVKVSILGFGSRSLTVGSNVAFDLDGGGSSSVDFAIMNFTYPNLSVDASGFTGTYRAPIDLAQQALVPARGTASIQSGQTISTGLGSSPIGIVQVYDTDDTSVPTTRAVITDQFSDGTMKVRFYNPATGAEVTGTTFSVAWTAWV